MNYYALCFGGLSASDGQNRFSLEAATLMYGILDCGSGYEILSACNYTVNRFASYDSELSSIDKQEKVDILMSSIMETTYLQSQVAMVLEDDDKEAFVISCMDGVEGGRRRV